MSGLGSDHDSGSMPTWSDAQPAGIVVDGMRLESHPAMGRPQSISWQVEGPAGEQRTYTVRHDGEVVDRVSGSGFFRIEYPYADGRWELSYGGADLGPCSVYADSVVVAVLERPMEADPACTLDTAWLND